VAAEHGERAVRTESSDDANEKTEQSN